jgi:outer membrane receptor protein involved in Fe transport
MSLNKNQFSFIMRSLLTTIFYFVVSQLIFGQEDAVVSGRVLEKTTLKPLAFATVTINKFSDGKLLTGTMTDEDGRFSITAIPQGEYNVSCSYLGYKQTKISLLVGRLNKSFDLGKIELEPDAAILGEVIISENKNLVSSNTDKKSFDIAGNISQAGGSVLDVMRNLPGITVDQEGKIELRGSDKITVLIDGKQSSLTGYGNQKGLSNIPASNIDKIEIINNPSAKYDAMGMAGIINIIYRKETKSGLTGDVGLASGIGALSQRKKDLPTELGSYKLNHKIIPSLNLNYRTGKLNLFFQSEILNQRRLPNNEFTTRIFTNGGMTISQVPENRKQTQYIVKAGADFNLNENNRFSFSMIYDYESHHDSAQVPYIDLLNSQDYRYRYWTWLEYEITGFMNYSLAYKHKFIEPGHELNASVQYTRGWEDETYHLNDSSAVRISDDYTHILAIEHTANLMVDYVRPLRSGRLEAGTKLQGRRIPVTYTVKNGAQSIIYPGLGDRSDWGEDTYAGYLNWVFESKKIDVEAGLRAEQTTVYYDLSPSNIYYPRNDSYDYFNFYPNIRITYKINQNNSLSAYFNKRVDRPGEPELRVFPKYDDPELLKVGNPYLRPQFTNTYELAYKLRWENGSMSISGYHRSIKDPFTRIYSIDSTNSFYRIVNKVYSNVGNAKNTGVEFILNQSLSKFWKLTGSINFYSNIIYAWSGIILFPYERPFTIERTNDNSADIKINNQFSFWKQTQVQLSLLYYTPKNIPQGKQMARSSVDLGIKQKVLGNKGEITCSFSDIFNRFGIRQKIKGDGFTALYENYYETQILSVGFRYKF